MACRAALHRSSPYNGTWQIAGSLAFEMSKKYEIVHDKIPVAGGGFIEAFRMALVDLSCFGERHLDLAGYPHESAEAALLSDWAALGVDMRAAAEKVAASAKDEGGTDSAGGAAKRGKEALE